MNTLQRARSCGWRAGFVLLAMGVAVTWATQAHAANGSWNVNGSGSWNTAGNWSPAAVPGTAAGDVVSLVNGITANRTVTINTAVTLGTLTIGSGSAFGFTLTGTTGGSLTLNNSGSGASLVQPANSGATNTIATGFTLADSFTVTNNQVTNGVTPLYALTISGNISESGGARTLTKTGVGTVVLSGSNTYSGKTTASAGILQFVNPSSLYGGTTANWTAANITSSSGATLAVRVGASNFTTDNVTTLLTNLGALGGSVTNGQGLQAGSSIGFDTSNAGGSFTLADAITNSTGAGGGAIGLVKLGSGTLSLTGLSSTAANNYTGTTIIDQGTLVLPSSQTTRFTGGLTFGSAVGTTNVGRLDLSNGSAEFAGATLVRSTTGTNGITIGAGQSLTSRGNVQIGDSTGLTGSNPSQSLVVQGSGTWAVTASNGSFRVGNASAARGVTAALDASGLSTLSIDLRLTGSTGGAFVVNENVNAGGAPTVKLAAVTTIKANSVALQANQGAGTAQLLLGTGAQVINANVLTIGNSSRGNDTVQFQDAVNGTLTLRDAAGTGRAAMNLGNYNQNMAGAFTSTFNVAGHSADMLMSSITAADLTLTTNANVGAVFSFDSGTFDATAITLGRKQSSSVGNIVGTATLNLGGTNNLTNTFTIGTLTMATMWSTAGTISAVVNIAGTTTTGTITSATLATTSTTGGVANGTMNISGGSTRITNGLTLVNRSGTPGTANGTLSITGGSLSVGGNVTTAGSGGTITSTVTLDGGSLNMNGFALGGSGQLIDNLNLRSGTLANVGQINNGADLAKTTSGTLSLTGTSTFTGATAVQAGVVRFNSVAATTGAQALGSGSVVNLGVAATSTGELDYFGSGGTLDKNVFALGNGRNRIRNSGGGTLTLSGTLTKNGTILELAQGTFTVAGQITGTSSNSDLYVNGATVTLSNTNNDYNGPTYVYGGGTLTLGASGVIPNGSNLILGGTGSDTGIGTISTGLFSDTVTSVTTSALGGTVTISGSGSTIGSLTTTGDLTFGAGTDTLALSLTSPTLGRYTIMTYAGTRSGTFDLVTGNGNYNVVYGAAANGTIDLQLKANQAAAFTLTPAATNVLAGGSTTLTGSIVNTSPIDSASLGISLLSTGSLTASGFASSAGSTLLAGGTSTITASLAAGLTAGVQNWSITNTDAAAITTVGTASGSITVFDPALASFTSGSATTSWLVDLGEFGLDSGTHSAGFSIYNLLSDPTFTADLMLLTILDGTGNTSVLSTNLSPFADLAAGSSNSWLASIATGTAGSFQNTYTLNFASAKNSASLGGPQSMTLVVQGIVVAVPEPGTIVLAGIGIAALGWASRGRRRRSSGRA